MVNGVLEVNLLDAKSLKDTDIIGKMDPYVLVSYRGKEHKSKIARGQGSNPSWNQTFKFSVNSPVADNHHQHKIDLRIMDDDTCTADDFVGEATIFVGDVIAQGVETGKGELRPANYSVVLADRTYCGEIRVGVIFTRWKNMTQKSLVDGKTVIGLLRVAVCQTLDVLYILPELSKECSSTINLCLFQNKLELFSVASVEDFL